MSQRERTIQQQYPLGAMTGRPVSLIAAVAAPAFALIMALRNGNDVGTPELALASFVFIGAASITVVVASSPLRAPLSSQSALFIIIWANAAMLLGAASSWQTNQHLRDDWGSAVVGLMILAMAPYRPPRELVLFGGLSAILAGFIPLLELPALVRPLPALVFVIVSITPIVACTIAPARFVGVILDGTDRWNAKARLAAEQVDEDNDWIARSVQQDRVTILNRDIVPFFTRVLRDDAVTQDDVLLARQISDEIRGVMVAEVDRSWLHMVVGQAVAVRRLEWDPTDAVVDPDRLAERMNLDQRSAVRAFIGALLAHPQFASRGFRIALAADGDLVRCIVNARLDCTETQLKSELAPYFAVMRILFSELTVDFEQPELTLQFFYDD